MNSLEYSTEEYMFHRARGKGDLFDSLKSAIEKKGAIPVDFYRIHYSEFPEQCHYHEVLKTNGNQKAEDFECMLNKTSIDRLGEVVEYLNKVYGIPSDNKIKFWLRTVQDIKKSDRLPPKILCGDLRVDISSTILSVYISNGWIKIHPTTLLNNKNKAMIAHDIGHGIFGFGHHEPRNCIMDFNNNGWAEQDYFCEEDRNTLYKLVNKIEI